MWLNVLDAPSEPSIDDRTLSISSSALTLLLCDVFARGKSIRFRARGFSMTPFIRNGDVVTIAPKKERRLGLGDIVAARHPVTGKTVVHRLVAIRSGGFMLQGDNSITSDGWVSEENILGVVTQIERDNKRVWLGLGYERYGIAFLARHRLLPLTIYQGRKIFSRFLRRYKHE